MSYCIHYIIDVGDETKVAICCPCVVIGLIMDHHHALRDLRSRSKWKPWSFFRKLSWWREGGYAFYRGLAVWMALYICYKNEWRSAHFQSAYYDKPGRFIHSSSPLRYGIRSTITFDALLRVARVSLWSCFVMRHGGSRGNVNPILLVLCPMHHSCSGVLPLKMVHPSWVIDCCIDGRKSTRRHLFINLPGKFFSSFRQTGKKVLRSITAYWWCQQRQVGIVMVRWLGNGDGDSDDGERWWWWWEWWMLMLMVTWLHWTKVRFTNTNIKNTTNKIPSPPPSLHRHQHRKQFLRNLFERWSLCIHLMPTLWDQRHQILIDPSFGNHLESGSPSFFAHLPFDLVRIVGVFCVWDGVGVHFVKDQRESIDVDFFWVRGVVQQLHKMEKKMSGVGNDNGDVMTAAMGWWWRWWSWCVVMMWWRESDGGDGDGRDQVVMAVWWCESNGWVVMMVWLWYGVIHRACDGDSNGVVMKWSIYLWWHVEWGSYYGSEERLPIFVVPCKPAPSHKGYYNLLHHYPYWTVTNDSSHSHHHHRYKSVTMTSWPWTSSLQSQSPSIWS